jgi:hypothetical protein
MRPILITIVTVALLAAACGASAGNGVASLEDGSTTGTSQPSGDEATVSGEDALLAFAQCMRDHGVEDFQDPIVGEGGDVTFGFGGPPGDGGVGGPFGGVDRDTVQAAFEACGEDLQGLAIGPGGGDFDPSEIEDQMFAFAQCLRDNGIDVDDPDFSNFGPRVNESDGQDADGGPTFNSPFGPNFDPTDPDVQAAIEVCQGEGGPFRLGGGPRGGPPGAGQGGG